MFASKFGSFGGCVCVCVCVRYGEGTFLSKHNGEIESYYVDFLTKNRLEIVGREGCSPRR